MPTNLLCRTVGLLALAAPFAACGGPAPDGPGGGTVEETQVALSVVPSNVQCVRIVVSVASQAAAFMQTVTPGASSATLSLGQIPAGNATFTGSGYNLACSSVLSTTAPAWIADSASAALSPGVVTTVSMTFRRNNPVAVSANFLDNVADIAVGAYATYARMADGTVKQWGDTDGSSPILSPTTVPGLTGVALVAPGDRFACALKTDGTVWCWGINWAGGLGSSVPVGGSQPTPVQVPGISGAIDLAAGSSHVCAIAKSSGGGAISCWGYNGVGELGDGTTTSSSIPRGVSMGGAQTYAGRIFAGGLHTCALGSDGRVACWGENANGELGDGTTIARSSPTFLSGLGDTVDIALGFYHACALGGDGVTRCWGDNGSGQIGDGTFAQRLTPVAVVGVTDGVQIVAGQRHTCVRRTNGSASCWGEGPAIGDGVGLSVNPLPIAVPTLGTNVLALRAHFGQHTCAQMADRTVRCWGVNNASQIGDGTFQFASKPVPVVLQ